MKSYPDFTDVKSVKSKCARKAIFLGFFGLRDPSWDQNHCTSFDRLTIKLHPESRPSEKVEFRQSRLFVFIFYCNWDWDETRPAVATAKLVPVRFGQNKVAVVLFRNVYLVNGVFGVDLLSWSQNNLVTLLHMRVQSQVTTRRISYKFIKIGIDIRSQLVLPRQQNLQSLYPTLLM